MHDHEVNKNSMWAVDEKQLCHCGPCGIRK